MKMCHMFICVDAEAGLKGRPEMPAVGMSVLAYGSALRVLEEVQEAQVPRQVQCVR